jgi:hypothetical protein
MAPIDPKAVDRVLEALGEDMKPWRAPREPGEPSYVHPWEASIQTLLALVDDMMRRRQDAIRVTKVRGPSPHKHREWLAWLETLHPETRFAVESRAHAADYTIEFIAGSVVPKFYGTITGERPITSRDNLKTAKFVRAVMKEVGVKLKTVSIVRYMSRAKATKEGA